MCFWSNPGQQMPRCPDPAAITVKLLAGTGAPPPPRPIMSGVLMNWHQERLRSPFKAELHQNSQSDRTEDFSGCAPACLGQRQKVRGRPSVPPALRSPLFFCALETIWCLSGR